MYGIVLICTLIIIGGIIAFIGDRMGSKIGKKKMSILGLRPKHTSTLITVISGILITTLTFLILSLASKDVRTALFGMEELKSAMHETKEKLKLANEELSVSDAKLDQSQRHIKKLQIEQQTLEQTAKELTYETEALNRETAFLTKEKEKLGAEKNILTDKNKFLNQENQDLFHINKNLTAENEELSEHTEALRKGLSVIRGGDIAFRSGEVLASGIVKAKRELVAIKKDMALLIEIANQEVERRTGKKDATGKIWIYEPEYEKATEMIEKSDKDIIVRIVALGNLVQGEPVRTALELFPNRLIYKKDELVLTRPFTLSDKHDTGEAQAIIVSFLKDINFEAKKKGILPDPLKGSIGLMEGEKFFQTAREIARKKGEIILSAFALNDINALGPLRIKITIENQNSY